MNCRHQREGAKRLGYAEYNEFGVQCIDLSEDIFTHERA